MCLYIRLALAVAVRALYVDTTIAWHSNFAILQLLPIVWTDRCGLKDYNDSNETKVQVFV